MNILDKIVAKKIKVVEQLKKEKSIAYFQEEIAKLNSPTRDFRKALISEEVSIIAEVKKASPSKGVFMEEFPYLDIALEYESSGATAISVLTEEDFFQGKNQYLTEISEAVNIPVLRKDFIVDEIQLYEARAIGADAVLLIDGILTGETLGRYIEICDRIGLGYIVEVHNQQQLADALGQNPKVIGINNRNLKTFETSLSTTEKLAREIPDDTIIISESGIFTGDDVALVKSFGARGVLVGESLIKSGNISEKIRELKYE